MMAEDTAQGGAAVRRALRRVPTAAVLVALGLVGLVTVLAGALGQWALAVTGLVVLQLGTVLAVLGPWGVRPTAPPVGGKAPAPAPASTQLQDLERRVDALGARLVASTERTRVELLDVLHGRTGDRPGDGRR